MELVDRWAGIYIEFGGDTFSLSFFQVNLKYGVNEHAQYLRDQHDTCTACAGTMILEFAALSRLTGVGIFEEKARRAMDFLWQQRHRGSDLMGTVLNVHNGDWVRKGNHSFWFIFADLLIQISWFR